MTIFPPGQLSLSLVLGERFPEMVGTCGAIFREGWVTAAMGLFEAS